MEMTSVYTPLNEFRFIDLAIIQPNWTKKGYFVMFDEEQLASLVWPKPFGFTCVGTTAHGSWNFTRKGFFAKEILISRFEEQRPLGIIDFKNKFKAKLLTNNLECHWKGIRIWRGEYGWHQDDKVILNVRSKLSFKKRQFALINMFKMDFSEEELSILLLSCLYVVLLSRQS